MVPYHTLLSVLLEVHAAITRCCAALQGPYVRGQV